MGLKKPKWSKISSFLSTYHYKETPPKIGDDGIQRFELYLVAKEKTEKPTATKIAMLLSAVGPEALERYNHFEWSEDEDKGKFDVVKAKFENELAGKKRIVFSRYQFWEYSKTASQTFDEFLTQL